MSDRPRNCPRCGREVPVGMNAGPCPACMLGRALGMVPDDEGAAEQSAQSPSAAEEVDGYALGEVLGEGGFGTVYRAQQQHPVRREVALKVLKPGMDSKQIIGRFEGERQALALMDHPAIARVLDAGTTRSGRPFFAMDLVDGLPIDAFCEREKLPLRERLELFNQVCEAVHHAHQRGIIHRDLKPSNILVTSDSGGRPLPKVIDFGIAKATEHILSDSTVLTVGPQLMGTPEYMSPEQALSGGGGVDTRADVYSLGAVLYVILTGEPPLSQSEFRDGGYKAILTAIAELEPQRPSQRATAIQKPADRQRTGILPGEIAGDLDWIVLKALAKEPERRYSSVDQFARDVGNLLANQPVTAHPPRVGYLVGKFVRRHRAAVMAGAAVLIALVAASIISAVMALRADKSAKLAGEKTREARHTFSLADYRAAGPALEGDDVPLGIAYLARSLRTDPENGMAAFKLAATLSMQRFPRSVGAPMVHDKEVVACRFDPSGGRAITQCRDDFVRVWEVKTGKLLAQIPSHRIHDRRVPSSADGSLFAACFERSKLRVWDAGTLLPVGKSLWHYDDITAVALHPNGEAIAAGAKNGIIQIWDLPSGELRYSLNHPGRTRCLLWHADGERLVSISSERTARLWNVETGEGLLSQLALPGPVFEINALSEDRLVVTTDGPRAGEEGFRMAIYDLGNFERIGGVRDLEDWVSSVKVHPGGRMLVTAGKGGPVQAWDLRDGQQGHVFAEKLPSYTGGLAFDPTGHRLAVTLEGGTIRIWDVRTGDTMTLLTASSYPMDCAWSPDGEMLLGCGSGEAWAWDLSDRRQHPTRFPHRYGLWHLNYSADSDKLATAQYGGRFQVWGAADGLADSEAMTEGAASLLAVSATPAKSLAAGLRRHGRFARTSGRGYPLLRGTHGSFRDFAASPDGQWLARSTGLEVRVRDLTTGTEIFTSQPAADTVREIAFSDDNRYLAAVADGGAIRVWSVGDWQLMHEVDAFDVAARAIAVSSSPLRIVAGTVWGGVFLWEPEGRGLVRVRADDHTSIVELKVDEPNNRIVVGTEAGAELWDLANLQALVPPLAHDVDRQAIWPVLLDCRDKDRLLTVDERSAVAWDLRSTPPEARRFGLMGVHAWALGVQGNLLVCASRKSSMLYDVDSGEALTPDLHWGYRIDTRELPYQMACAISGDRRRLAIATNDGAASQWDLPPVSGTVPGWLPDLAEALVGFALSERGERSDVTAERRNEVLHQLRSLEGDSQWNQWGRWFAGETGQRPISPYGQIKLTDYQRRFAEAGKADLLRHVLRITPANRELSAKLLAVLEKDNQPDTSVYHEIGCLRSLLASSKPSEVQPAPSFGPKGIAGWRQTRSKTHIALAGLAYCPKAGTLFLGQRLRYGGGLFRVDEELRADFLTGVPYVCSLAVSPDGTQLVYSQDFSGKITRYDIASRERKILRQNFYSGDNDPMGLAFVPKGFKNPIAAAGEILHVDPDIPSARYYEAPGPNRVFAWDPAHPDKARTVYEGYDLTHVLDLTFGGDRIWLADADYFSSKGGIYLLQKDAKVVPLATAEPIWPVALCFDAASGTLLAADRRQQRVVRIDPEDGSVEEIATGFADLSPSGIAVRADGRAFYVSDIGMATAYEFELSED